MHAVPCSVEEALFKASEMPTEDLTVRSGGVELQIALLACRAVHSADPIAFLKSCICYHNTSGYHVQDRGSSR